MNAYNTPRPTSQCRGTGHESGVADTRQVRNGVRSRNQFPALYMPAMPPLGLIDSLERWIVARVRQWQRRRHFRRQAVNLLAYDDRILADLGLDRGEIERASRQSLDEDVRQALSGRRARHPTDSA